MIVSILQLMGFPVGKPVHSRASDTPDRACAVGDKGGITASEADRKREPRQSSESKAQHQAHPARRQEVKTQAVKAKPAAKAAKAAKAAVKGKPAPKATPVAKAKPKAAPAKPTKPAKPAQAVAAPAKPTKPVAKAAPAKVTTVAKPAATKSAKAAPMKAAQSAKPTAKTAPAKVREASRPAAKAGPNKATPAPAPIKSKAVAPAPVAAPVVAKPVKALALPPVSPVLVTTPTPPPKAGRPSSRLAQLTVPSMAQSVASTAAKASYIQTMSAPLIAPPVASAAKKDPKLANNWKTKPVEQLTDADLMAMPDAEYMNATQLAVFRLKLSVLKQDILSMAGETTEHLREDTVVVPDPADRATIEEEHALELRTRDRERKLLKKIEQSITRIDAGDYGYCDETGEPIGVGRLLARPTATLSLEAQQRRELKQKMFGD